MTGNQNDNTVEYEVLFRTDADSESRYAELVVMLPYGFAISVEVALFTFSEISVIPRSAFASLTVGYICVNQHFHPLPAVLSTPLVCSWKQVSWPPQEQTTTS